jgi:hypothetical protein
VVAKENLKGSIKFDNFSTSQTSLIKIQERGMNINENIDVTSSISKPNIYNKFGLGN